MEESDSEDEAMQEVKTTPKQSLIIAARKTSRKAQRDAQTLLRLLKTYSLSLSTIDGDCAVYVLNGSIEGNCMQLTLGSCKLRLQSAFETYARGVTALLCKGDYMELRRRMEVAKCHVLSLNYEWSEFIQGIEKLGNALVVYRPETKPEPRIST